MNKTVRTDHGEHQWVIPRRANNPFMSRTSERPICGLCGIPRPYEHQESVR